MSQLPFIDIHTHHTRPGKDRVSVINLFPNDAIHEFEGKNFYSMGLHPWKIKTMEENNSSLIIMEDALEFDHVIFVGECGLDKITSSDYEEQKRVFIAQAMMAEEYQKPLIIHSVRSYNEISELYKANSFTMPWIFHGYTGSPEMTLQLASKNFLFSFGKILFSERARAVESFKSLPLQKIFLETDEFNISVEEIYKKAAELKNLSIDEIKEAVWNNFNRLENVSFEIS